MLSWFIGVTIFWLCMLAGGLIRYYRTRQKSEYRHRGDDVQDWDVGCSVL